jgi:hypothetical protein
MPWSYTNMSKLLWDLKMVSNCLCFSHLFFSLATTVPCVSPLYNKIQCLIKLVHVSLTANIMASMVSRYSQAGWAQEGGDPCLPASWSWVQCSSEDAPRVFSMYDNWHIIPSVFNICLPQWNSMRHLRIFFLAAHCLGRTLQEVSQWNWQSYQGWLNCKDWILYLLQVFDIYCLIYLFLLMQKAWRKFIFWPNSWFQRMP